MLRPRARLAATLAAAIVVLGACAAGEDDGVGSTTTIDAVSEVGQRRPWDGMVLPPDVGQRYEALAEVEAELAELAELGAPNVALVVPLVQDDPAGLPRRHEVATPSDEALASLMAAARQVGLGVVLQVRVEVSARPAATPTPADPERWFRRYGELAVHYARLAERHGASLLVVGGSLGDLAAADDAWGDVLGEVRAAYAGPVSFAVEPAQLDRVAVWDAVDVIGVDVAFPPEPDEPEPIAADLEKAWEPVLAELSALAEAWSRPVVLTRVGFPGARRTAPDQAGVSPDRQLSAYEALFTVANQTPAIEGVLVWRWGTDPATAGEVDATYSPEGRPAEEVLRRAWTTPLAGDPAGGGGQGRAEASS